jgi:hypothetical protein
LSVTVGVVATGQMVHGQTPGAAALVVKTTSTQ